MKRLLVALVRVYQLTIGRLLPPACRYEPSCSRYMIEALRTHGALRGLGLGLWRICRCHPLAPGGPDPVPPARSANAGGDEGGNETSGTPDESAP